MTVRLFAGAAEVAGTRTVVLRADGPLTVGQAFQEICRQIPALSGMESHVLFAANAAYAGPDSILQPGDQLAVIPPVSGGTGP